MNEELRLHHLINSVGDFIQHWGFKAIDGRVWSLIFLSKDPISTPEIVINLGVSKGLISVAINELLEYKLIIAHDKVQNGAQTYIPNMNIGSTIQEVLKVRELNKITETQKHIEYLSKLSKTKLSQLNLSNQKLSQLKEFTQVNKLILESIISKKSESLDSWIKALKRYRKFI